MCNRVRSVRYAFTNIVYKILKFTIVITNAKNRYQYNKNIPIVLNATYTLSH